MGSFSPGGVLIADAAFHHGLISFSTQVREAHRAENQMLDYAKNEGWLDKGKKE